MSFKANRVCEGLTFSILSDGTYSVSAKNASNSQITGEVCLPDLYNNKIIKELADESFFRYSKDFKYNEYTKKVTLPKYLEKIGSSTFEHLINLTEIILPNTLKEIGSRAFNYTSITSIDLLESLKYIGDDAFSSCANLDTVNINSDLDYVGTNAFHYKKWITSLGDGLVYIKDICIGYNGEIPNVFTLDMFKKGSLTVYKKL